MNNFNYNNMTPFKWFVLENFPFIENDFEAINNYRLFSKVVEYLNKTIDDMNAVGQQTEDITNAMTELQNYVNNYFDNLDVQDEINNKLDEMVEDGTLEDLLYNVVYDEKVVMIGDSYGVGNTSGGYTTGWCDRLRQLMNIPTANYYKFVEGGAGFLRKGLSNHNFLELLQANISKVTDKTKVKKVILCGGYNDHEYTSAQITTNLESFINYCKEQFPNATIYIGMVGNSKKNDNTGASIRNSISNAVLRGYQNCVTFGAVYLNGIENIMHDYDNFMSNDYIHPTDTGYKYLASYLFNAIKTGYADYQSEVYNSTLDFTDMAEDSTFNIKSKLSNNVVSLFAPASNIKFTQSNYKNIGNSIVLGNIDVHFFRPTTRLVSIPVKYYMRTNSNTYYGGIGNLIFNTNGTLTFMPGILLNNGSSYFTVNEVTTINFEAFNYTIPTTQG